MSAPLWFRRFQQTIPAERREDQPLIATLHNVLTGFTLRVMSRAGRLNQHGKHQVPPTMKQAPVSDGAD